MTFYTRLAACFFHRPLLIKNRLVNKKRNQMPKEFNQNYKNLLRKHERACFCEVFDANRPATTKHTFAEVNSFVTEVQLSSDLQIEGKLEPNLTLTKHSFVKAELGLNVGKNVFAKRIWPYQSQALRNKAINKQTFVQAKPEVLLHPDSEESSGHKTTRTIVVTSGKGGVGKTTTTANLGMSIARLGYRVTLIDADIGLRNLDLLLGLENRVLYTAMDIFEGDCRLDQALIRDKRLKNLCLLAISKNRQRYNVTRQKMDSLISSICALGSDFILIDCPAGIDIGFINAISPAQEALIITTPEITAMRDADRVAGLLEANGIYNAKLLINRVRPDMIQRHDMMSVQDVQDVLGIPLLGAIPEDLNVIISTNRGEPLVLSKKLSLSGVAFENAARRLVGKQEYLIDLKSPYKNIFHKLLNKTWFS